MCANRRFSSACFGSLGMEQELALVEQELALVRHSLKLQLERPMNMASAGAQSFAGGPTRGHTPSNSTSHFVSCVVSRFVVSFVVVNSPPSPKIQSALAGLPAFGWFFVPSVFPIISLSEIRFSLLFPISSLLESLYPLLFLIIS